MRDMHNELMGISVPCARELRQTGRGRAWRAAFGPGRFVAVGLFGLGVLLTAQPAAAEKPREGSAAAVKGQAPEARAAQLDELFKVGVAHYSAKRYQEAEAAFLEVWRERRTFDVAANLGHAEYQLGKLPEAAGHLSYALENWPMVGKPGPRELAARRLAEAKGQLGTLVVRVSRPEAEIAIDGKRVGEARVGNEVFVMPGKHRVEAKLAGYEPAATTLEVGKGTSRKVALALRPVEQDSGGKNLAVIVSGAAVSLAAVGTGVGSWLAGEGKRDQAEEIARTIPDGGCDRSLGKPLNAKCDELKSALQASDTLKNVGIVFLMTGSAVGVATIVYGLWPASKQERQQGIRFAPVVTGSSGGLYVTGTF
jgi:tetratricopeptide (TPR) repeat protein